MRQDCTDGFAPFTPRVPDLSSLNCQRRKTGQRLLIIQLVHPVPRWRTATRLASAALARGDHMVRRRGLEAFNNTEPGMAEVKQPDPNPSRLDAQALDRLRELDPDGRHGVVQRVLTAFEGSLARMRTVLEAQARADVADAGVVNGIAHTLKSSSASVGALALARTCAEVELHLRQNPGCELAPEIQQLLADSAAALVAVRAMLRS